MDNSINTKTTANKKRYYPWKYWSRSNKTAPIIKKLANLHMVCFDTFVSCNFSYHVCSHFYGADFYEVFFTFLENGNLYTHIF